MVVRTGVGVGHADGRAGAGGGSPASIIDDGAGNGREGRPDGEGATGRGWGSGGVDPCWRPLRAAGREGRWPG
jgi:hypothetical protein